MKRPLTQPEPGDPNHGKSCYQPGSLHTTDLPMQPSLAEQMHGAEKDPVQVPPFDYKACILCDHVIVQKILGNKCGQSGSLCCNLKECPITRREAAPVPAVKEEIPCCENNCPAFGILPSDDSCAGDGVCEIRGCTIHPMIKSWIEIHGCLHHPGARAYLNKDVIAELESWINGLEYPDCPPGDAYAQVIALLKGDDK